jgi:hypothetical protein
MELRGAGLEQLLLRSRHLYASLAVLHDEQEIAWLHFLAGVQGFLRYPETDFTDVLEGRLTIRADRFVVAGTPTEPKLRFHRTVDPLPTPDTLVRQCPAQRLRTAAGQPYNDVLWDLLVAIYRETGELD